MFFFCCFSIPVDVFQSDIWQELASFDSPELTRLASSVQESVIRSRADSTTKKYLGAFRRWKTWAQQHSLQVFPVKESHLVLYMQSLAESSSSNSAVEEIYNAMSWIHAMANCDSPTDSQFVGTVMQGLQRNLAQPVTKKLLVTTEMLAAIVDDAEKSRSLADWRLATACVISYAAFLRFNELIHIRAVDVKFNDEFMSISIPKSKTDQLRKGEKVVVARTSSKLCPVNILQRYMAYAGIQTGDTRFIFQPIVKLKHGEKLRESGSLSYTRLQECFKGKLESLGFPAECYGLHSLRAGGATAAANGGVPDRLFKRHGRWKSDSAKDGYVEDSLHARLSVSSNLGL